MCHKTLQQQCAIMEVTGHTSLVVREYKRISEIIKKNVSNVIQNDASCSSSYVIIGNEHISLVINKNDSNETVVVLLLVQFKLKRNLFH